MLLIGTTRRDGSARIGAVEPLILDGDLWLSMMSRSTKALDLTGTRGQHVARWPDDTEYIRPATTPTSLGARQQVRRILS